MKQHGSTWHSMGDLMGVFRVTYSSSRANLDLFAHCLQLQGRETCAGHYF